MNRTKRISALLLALLMALALCACAAPEADAPSYTPDTRTSAPTGSLPPAAETDGPADPTGAAPVETEEPSIPPETAPAKTEDLPGPTEAAPPETEEPSTPAPAVSEDGWYDSKEEVALYLHLYGHLPGNYVTKAEAEALGWTGGSVEPYAGEGTALGGSRFGNYEGLLPKAEGRTYTECDIDTVGRSSRGAKRLVFSNDGLIYYTEDHYESFELLYGEP